ncbi:hypothetical protein PBNK65NY_000509300 [Plasmodium berghei]|uniref:Uncharacterized protein n=1 Tax=Plasmodium berghei TaxID=5821 RepID=A0A1C6WET2_PLABE|nr:hypothetical protein PBNK65NY_000509300 [Plasmodium berghei]
MENLRGSSNSFDDLVDDVIQYMNQIQDEISNDNQTDDESHNIVTTKKKTSYVYYWAFDGRKYCFKTITIIKESKRRHN